MSALYTNLLIGIFVGLALSVDALLVSFAYGLTIKSKKAAISLSLLIGTFHFIMPIIGYSLSYVVFKRVLSIGHLRLHVNAFRTLIFFILGSMILLNKDGLKSNVSLLTFLGKLLLAFSVSIDSFFVGIALSSTKTIHLLFICFIFFSLCGFLSLMAIGITHYARRNLSVTRLNIVSGILFIIAAFLSFILR